jgi:hypothetical protein
MGLEYLILEHGLGAPGLPVDESSMRGAIEPFGVLLNSDARTYDIEW